MTSTPAGPAATPDGSGPTPDDRAGPAVQQATADEFRAALARLAAGVALLTAHDPEEGQNGGDAGMTATAFLSVSLEPPLVLVGLHAGARMDELLTRQPHWSVSVLGESQRHIAGRFAMRARVSDRLLFEGIPYRRGEASGAPLLDDALAVVECRTEQRVEAGDHVLVIGRVLTARAPSATGLPLVRFRGRYRTLG